MPDATAVTNWLLEGDPSVRACCGTSSNDRSTIPRSEAPAARSAGKVGPRGSWPSNLGAVLGPSNARSTYALGVTIAGVEGALASCISRKENAMLTPSATTNAIPIAIVAFGSLGMVLTNRLPASPAAATAAKRRIDIAIDRTWRVNAATITVSSVSTPSANPRL